MQNIQKNTKIQKNKKKQSYKEIKNKNLTFQQEL